MCVFCVATCVRIDALCDIENRVVFLVSGVSKTKSMMVLSYLYLINRTKSLGKLTLETEVNERLVFRTE